MIRSPLTLGAARWLTLDKSTKMSFIVIVGCDGAGKSTVLKGLVSIIQREGSEIYCGHWRPNPFSRKADAGHAATADDPHGQVPRGAVGSIVKLGWIWVNWWAGWLLGLRARAGSGYVLFDRYHGDLLVDPRRYRYGGPMWMARLWSRTLPQPDHLIFLDAPVDVLLARKQEVAADVLELSRAGYSRLVQQRGGKVIDVNRSVDEIVSDVLAVIGLESREQ